MIILRQEQIKAMEQCALDTLKKRMHKHLLDAFPARTAKMSGTEIDHLIENAIGQAQEYQINRSRDVERFIELVLVYLSEFEEKDTRVNEILTDPDYDGEDKVDELELYFKELGIYLEDR